MPFIKASLKEAFFKTLIFRRNKPTMRCTYCGTGQTRALDTRTIKKKNVVKRRRECMDCGKRFTTYEVIASEKVSK